MHFENQLYLKSSLNNDKYIQLSISVVSKALIYLITFYISDSLQKSNIHRNAMQRPDYNVPYNLDISKPKDRYTDEFVIMRNSPSNSYEWMPRHKIYRTANELDGEITFTALKFN